MVVYSIFFKESVHKDLRTIPKKDLGRILNRIKALAENPRPPGCEKLSGQERFGYARDATASYIRSRMMH